MIDQKQVLQLIGEWGYTPSSFEKYIISQRDRSKDIGESVGMTMYASLLTLCKYATSGDAKKSVQDETERKISPELASALGEDILGTLNSENFSDGVVDSIYDICSQFDDIKGAELAMRKNIMLVVAPIIIQKIVDIASKISEQVIETFVGADHALNISRTPKLESALKSARDNMNKFVSRVETHVDEIKKCQQTEIPQFNELVGAVIGDIDETILEVKEDMLSIIDQPPHKWTNYSIKFGKMMAGLIIAMSFGYITNDEYEDLLKDFKGLTAISDTPENNVFFGAN